MAGHCIGHETGEQQRILHFFFNFTSLIFYLFANWFYDNLIPTLCHSHTEHRKYWSLHDRITVVLISTSETKITHNYFGKSPRSILLMKTELVIDLTTFMSEADSNTHMPDHFGNEFRFEHAWTWIRIRESELDSRIQLVWISARFEKLWFNT